MRYGNFCSCLSPMSLPPSITRLSIPMRHLICIGTLLAFVTSSVGVPWFAESNSSCQCDKNLKAAGQCCCFLAKNGQARASCCSSSPLQAKSCCSSSAKSCCDTKPQDSCGDTSGSRMQVSGYCGCGGPAEIGLLINAEPRILADAAIGPRDAKGTRWLPPQSMAPPSCSLLPETPPPEMCSLFFSLV